MTTLLRSRIVVWSLLSGMVAAVLLAPRVVFAQDATAPADLASAIVPADTAWMLVSSALVLLMTPGLAFFYGGLVRGKNVLSVLMQCFTCMSVMTLLWVTVGFSLAFGTDMAGGLVGNPFDYFLLRNVAFDKPWPNLAISGQLFMIFQCMFAVITPGLILGAFAERMKFGAFTLFMSLWLLIVYCPVAHWVWGGAGGFFALGGDGALDFAGGTVVHVNAGVAALVAALVIGKRVGYPRLPMLPHNLPFAVLGAGLLWFGWFGFNAGSAGAANDQAVRAFVVTHIAAAAAGAAWALIERLKNGHATVLGIITGAVAGLVAITPASGFVDAGGAIAIGAGASLLSYLAVARLKPRFGYDDSLDVFGVHGVSGIWGALATGIWAVQGYGVDQAGGLLAGNGVQLAVQAKALAYTLAWSGAWSYGLLRLVHATIGLRVGDVDEEAGLDATDHNEAAYN